MERSSATASVPPVRIEGTRRFDAARETVWDALVDPHLLADFLPGIQELEVTDGSHWTAVMKLPLAPVSLKLHFEVRERRKPDRALLHARGKRLGAGAEVATSFVLADDGGATTMQWHADVELSGALRTLGGGALRPVAEQQAERFLDRLDEQVTGAR